MPAKKTTKVEQVTTTRARRSSNVKVDAQDYSSGTKAMSLSIPTKELDQWLRGRITWTHQDWEQLLDSLRKKGYQQMVDNPEWQKAVGAYLEETRMKNVKLPVEELNQWLSKHTSWDHNEWLGLLAQLRAKGYSMLTDNEFGQALIGRYLEEHRRK